MDDRFFDRVNDQGWYVSTAVIFLVAAHVYICRSSNGTGFYMLGFNFFVHSMNLLILLRSGQ